MSEADFVTEKLLQIEAPAATPVDLEPAVRATTHRVYTWLLFPFLLGLVMVATNRWFTVVDDEYAIINAAAVPLRHVLDVFLQGVGQHEHPPLYDVLLHEWLVLTSGNADLLRIPSICFYVMAICLLGKIADKISGAPSRNAILMISVLWPYGFHFGRVTLWYSFVFLLSSGVTWAYLNWAQEPDFKNWSILTGCGLLLVYANYLGWVLLACLALDSTLQDRKIRARLRVQLLGSLAVLLVLYEPIVAAFINELHNGTQAQIPLTSKIEIAVYNLYCFFVSESVAPWLWIIGVPACAAIAIILAISLLGGPSLTRRLMFYSAGIFASISFLGIGNTKRMIIFGPWLILAIGLSLGTMRANIWKRILAAALGLVAGLGWYGIFARNLYAAPHWVEPWQQVALQSARVIRQGGTVVSNSSPFFFYLTYDLAVEKSSTDGSFAGFLPEYASYPRVYNPNQWLTAGAPLTHTVLLIRGADYHSSGSQFGNADASLYANQLLTSHCGLQKSERLLRDRGAGLKQAIAPDLRSPEWRVDIETYECVSRDGQFDAVSK